MKNVFKVIALLFVLQACGSKANNSTQENSNSKSDEQSIETESDTIQVAKLFGIYMIKEFEGKNIEEYKIVGKSPFILFDEKEMAYSTSIGCNQISGKFEIGSGSTLKFKPGMSTMMACPDSLEDNYIKALSSITRYVKYDSELELYKDDSLKVSLVSAIK